MPAVYQQSTSGGKGNLGLFNDRNPRICAAGIPSAQSNMCVRDCLQHYLLKDEVDALIGDAIIPPSKPRPFHPLRHSNPLDKRHGGTFSDFAKLCQLPVNTKFQTIVADLKDTVYSSYWKKPLGQVRDPSPMLPEGFDIYGKRFGKSTRSYDRLYDIILPKEPYPANTPKAYEIMKRHYCEPPFNADLTFGQRMFLDKRGTYVRCCLTDDRVALGTSYLPISSIQSNFNNSTQSKIGAVLAPNDNTKNVPEGYSFGMLKAPDDIRNTLTACKINEGLEELKQCLKALNSLRQRLRSKYLPTFFHNLYLNLKYLDKKKTGWIPNYEVYTFCATKFIRFNAALIEPLLSMWRAFDGSNIKYETFAFVINPKNPLPDIPKIPDVSAECLDFRTTYTEMVKPGQEPNLSLRAGLPSGRYFDIDYPITPRLCCKAHRTCLPEESDMKACINPSILTLLHVNHRDMYEKREPEVVRRVFEAGNDNFTDDQFNTIWEAAKKYHAQGWVCYETFRRALQEIEGESKARKNYENH